MKRRDNVLQDTQVATNEIIKDTESVGINCMLLFELFQRNSFFTFCIFPILDSLTRIETMIC